ncbi:MAG: hypothetical protein CR982_08515 [Candidatus Cloacimonadota bacterium]|nr:MAG: hypothetical protein CR982_08515 [Candidatus Cloacimonadota bacterium]PIE78677.1 MAG: hypothetical protein CSA15_06440 [Candidatus Delongbacteria bacterium]
MIFIRFKLYNLKQIYLGGIMRFLAMLITAILIVACSKSDQKNYTVKEINGIKTFKNSTKPSQKLEIKPQKLFTINGDNLDSLQVLKMPMKVSIDSNKDIYILDIMQSNIKKYDSNGNFIKVISKHGMGPGELTYPNGMALIEDTIYVANQPQKKIIKFDKDGNFVGEIFIPDGTTQMFQEVGKDKIIGYVPSKDLEKQQLNINLSILDKKFKVIKELTKGEIKFGDSNVNVLDLIFPYTASNKEIFVSENSDDRYLINVYSFDGKPIYNIEKQYRKLKISEKELEDLNRIMGKTGVGSSGNKVTTKYKKAINDLFVDNKGRLWVKCSIDRNENNSNDYVVDIFKDGIFLDRVVFDGITGKDFFNPTNMTFVYDDRIYIFDMEGSSLSVYKY